jgi:hypothetical protein
MIDHIGSDAVRMGLMAALLAACAVNAVLLLSWL